MCPTLFEFIARLCKTVEHVEMNVYFGGAKPGPRTEIRENEKNRGTYIVYTMNWDTDVSIRENKQ